MVNKWEPIGLFPLAPEDEYINEIKKHEYLNATLNITEEKLAKKINEIFIMSFGRYVYIEDIEECLNIAKDIINNQEYGMNLDCRSINV